MAFQLQNYIIIRQAQILVKYNHITCYFMDSNVTLTIKDTLASSIKHLHMMKSAFGKVMRAFSRICMVTVVW